MKTHIASIALLLLLLPQRIQAQGTAIFYQGTLNHNGSPANGSYDLTFTIFNAITNGEALAGPITNATIISNGWFVATLDFGPGVFTGANRWLEIGVATNDTFATLSPRQPILATPYAIMANTASNLLGSVPAAQITGTIPAASLPGNLSGSFAGNGAGLTNVTAANSINQFGMPLPSPGFSVTISNNWIGNINQWTVIPADLAGTNITWIGGWVTNNEFDFTAYNQNGLDPMPFGFGLTYYGNQVVIVASSHQQMPAIVMDGQMGPVNDANYFSYQLDNSGNYKHVLISNNVVGFHAMEVWNAYTLAEVLVPTNEAWMPWPKPLKIIIDITTSVGEKTGTAAFSYGIGNYGDFLRESTDFRNHGIDYWRLPQGGTGIVNPGASTNLWGRIPFLLSTYSNAVNQVGPANVCIQIGDTENDSNYGTNAVYTNAFRSFTNLVALLPSCHFLIKGPVPLGNPPDSRAVSNEWALLQAGLNSGLIHGPNQYLGFDQLLTGASTSGTPPIQTAPGNVQILTDFSPGGYPHQTMICNQLIAQSELNFYKQNWPFLFQ